MCDYSGRLVAWLDRELPEPETTDIKRHLKACAECRNRLASYQKASSSFEAYCDAMIVTKGNSRTGSMVAAKKMSERSSGLLRLVPMASATAVITAMALVVALPRGSVELTAAHALVASTSAPPPHSLGPGSSTMHLKAADQPGMIGGAAHPLVHVANPSHRRHSVAGTQRRNSNPAPNSIQSKNASPAEPAIEIAIPAEAIYPPGAVPEGVNFIADIAIAADGSLQPVGLRPRLVGFESK